MFKVILDDLRSRVGEKIYLSPEDLEPLLDISKGQQANLRSQNRFPIPTRKLGGKVVVTIYDLAKHLSADCKESVSHTIATERVQTKEKTARSTKKTRKGLLEKGWWQFHSGQVFAIIERAIYKEHLSASENDFFISKAADSL